MASPADLDTRRRREAGTAGRSHDALAPFGAVITSIPITPKSVLTALGYI
jgi:hypothetical protein